MRREKSCGAVVFKKDNGKIKFLVEEMYQGHFAFPKGHVLFSETEHETAKREIKEETNLEVSFISNFRYKTSYMPAKNVIKDVIYFLAKNVDDSTLKHDNEEVKNLLWLEFEDAYNTITFENDKEILNKAYNHLNSLEFRSQHEI